jgi:hypothetical protein
MVKKTNGHKVNGRPRLEIDWKLFENLCILQCSIEEICLFFHISHQTLERRCKEYYGETFGQVFEKKRVGGLISLRRNLFNMSAKNPAVAIFMAKNLLGMSDRQEQTVDITTKGESIKPQYVDIPNDTVKEAIDILAKSGIFTISSN